MDSILFQPFTNFERKNLTFQTYTFSHNGVCYLAVKLTRALMVFTFSHWFIDASKKIHSIPQKKFFFEHLYLNFCKKNFKSNNNNIFVGWDFFMICKIYKWHTYAANHREICSLLSCKLSYNFLISLIHNGDCEVHDAFW